MATSKEKTSEEPQRVVSPRENFGDTSVPVEEIHRRLNSLRSRFALENGMHIWILRNNNQSRTDGQTPVPQDAVHVRVMARSARNIGFLHAHNMNDGTMKGWKNRRRGGMSAKRQKEQWKQPWKGKLSGQHYVLCGSDCQSKVQFDAWMLWQPCPRALAPRHRTVGIYGPLHSWGRHSQPSTRENCRRGA